MAKRHVDMLWNFVAAWDMQKTEPLRFIEAKESLSSILQAIPSAEDLERSVIGLQAILGANVYEESPEHELHIRKGINEETQKVLDMLAPLYKGVEEAQHGSSFDH